MHGLFFLEVERKKKEDEDDVAMQKYEQVSRQEWQGKQAVCVHAHKPSGSER